MEGRLCFLLQVFFNQKKKKKGGYNMRKVISCLLLVCFSVYSSGIAWAVPRAEIRSVKIPRAKIPRVRLPPVRLPPVRIPRVKIPRVRIPPIDDSYIDEVMASITSVKKDVVTIDYDSLESTILSYADTLPDIPATRLRIPKLRKLPEVKIEMGRYTAWLGGSCPGTIDATYIQNASEFVGEKVTLTFEAADSETQAIMDAYPSLFDIPDPQLLSVVTIISVNGEPVVIGEPFPLTEMQFINISTLSDEGEWKLIDQSIFTSGSRSNIYFGPGETLKTAKQCLLNLEKDLQSYADPEALLSNETIDEFLFTLNHFYFGLLSYYRNYIASIMDVKIKPTLSIGYATRQVKRHRSYYFQTSLVPGSIQLNVPKTGTDVSGPDELKFRQVFGGISTNLESFAIEVLTGLPSFSTGRVFVEAMKQEIPIYSVDPIDPTDSVRILGEIQLSQTAKIVIHNYIHEWGKDRIAICPQTRVMLDGVLVEGFILHDRETGESKYMILTSLNGGSSANPFDGASGDIAEGIGKGIEFLDAIVIGGTSILAGGVHIYSGLIIASAFSKLPAAATASVAFAGIGVAMGTCIAGIGVVITVKLIHNLYFACILTTRENYYV